MKAIESDLRFLLTLALLLGVGLPTWAGPAALAPPAIVQGDQWAVYDVSSVKGEPYCLPYANNGYALEVLGSDPVSRRVRVHCVTDELRCRAVFPPDGTLFPGEARAYLREPDRNPELARLAGKLTDGCRTQQEAVTRLLCWVSLAIEYQVGPDVAEGPMAVLKQRQGNCVGASELAVALLREAGIPARGVRGFLAPETTGRRVDPGIRTTELSLGQEGLHRWIEVYYPGAGWVFSDPFRSVNHVSPSYLVFDLESPIGTDPYAPAVFERLRPVVSDSVSTFIRLLTRGGATVESDLLPHHSARSGMVVRRNGPVQYRPAFIGLVSLARDDDRPMPDSVRLQPQGLEAPVLDGIFSFVDIEPGTHRLLFYRGRELVGRGRADVHFPPRRRGAVPVELSE